MRLASACAIDESYEKRYIKADFDSRWTFQAGEKKCEFEKNLACGTQINHSLNMSTGFSGIHFLLKSLRVGKRVKAVLGVYI